MKVLIAGSSGLIGQALMQALSLAGSQAFKLKRVDSSENPLEIPWDPTKKQLSPERLEGFDVIINLAGENIQGKWTTLKKLKIKESRLKATSLLAQTIAQLKSPPDTFINASAIGYYGNRGEEVLTEESPPGSGFLAEVCKEWEEAVKPAEKFARCIQLRLGVVLSPEGGALKSMLLPFKLGMGGKVGSGKQFMSWISIHDVVAAIIYLIQKKECRGPFNLTAPNPATNEEFTKTLGMVLHRPTFLPLPNFAVKLIFGEMGENLLLSSTRAQPQKLLDSGFQFMYPTLLEALNHHLKKI